MKVPDLTLPHSGGVVHFRDDNDLTGAQYRTVRRYQVAGEFSLADVIDAGIATLISGWEVPGFPELPLPAFDKDGGVTLGGLQILNWRDLQAIEKAVIPFLNECNGHERPADASNPDPKEA